MFKTMYQMFTRKGWIDKIIQIIVNSGSQYVWESQLAGSLPFLKSLTPPFHTK